MKSRLRGCRSEELNYRFFKLVVKLTNGESKGSVALQTKKLPPMIVRLKFWHKNTEFLIEYLGVKNSTSGSFHSNGLNFLPCWVVGVNIQQESAQPLFPKDSGMPVFQILGHFLGQISSVATVNKPQKDLVTFSENVCCILCIGCHLAVNRCVNMTS